jgi:hypothetical protein
MEETVSKFESLVKTKDITYHEIQIYRNIFFFIHTSIQLQASGGQKTDFATSGFHEKSQQKIKKLVASEEELN